MNERFVELVKQYRQNKTEVLQEKNFFIPKMLHGLAWDWILASVVQTAD